MLTILSRMPAHEPAVPGKIFSHRVDRRGNRRVLARVGDMIIPWAPISRRDRLEKCARVTQIRWHAFDDARRKESS